MLQRGAIMFFVQGIIHSVNWILIAYHIKLEISRAFKDNHNRLNLKSIPFLVFAATLCGLTCKIICGALAYVYDVSEPHSNKWFFLFFSVTLLFWQIRYLVIALLWIKMVVVFFDRDNVVHLNRIVIVTRAIIIAILINTTWYVIFNAINFANPSLVNTDYMFRIGNMVIVVLLSASFIGFGRRLLGEIMRNNKANFDQLFILKLKGMLRSFNVVAIVAAILPTIYLWVAKNKPPQDWFNLAIYIVELFSVYINMFLLGRSKLCKHVRKDIMHMPELISSKDSSNVGAEIALSPSTTSGKKEGDLDTKQHSSNSLSNSSNGTPNGADSVLSPTTSSSSTGADMGFSSSVESTEANV